MCTKAMRGKGNSHLSTTIRPKPPQLAKRSKKQPQDHQGQHTATTSISHPQLLLPQQPHLFTNQQEHQEPEEQEDGHED